MAYKFSASNTVVARLEGLMREVKQEAKSTDGQERPPKRIQRSKFVSTRTQRRRGVVAGKFTIFD